MVLDVEKDALLIVARHHSQVATSCPAAEKKKGKIEKNRNDTSQGLLMHFTHATFQKHSLNVDLQFKHEHEGSRASLWSTIPTQSLIGRKMVQLHHRVILDGHLALCMQRL